MGSTYLQIRAEDKDQNIVLKSTYLQIRAKDKDKDKDIVLKSTPT